MKEFFRTRCTLQISSWEGSHHASLALPLSLTIIYTSSHFCLGSGVTHPAHRGQIYYLFSFLFITPPMEVSEGELWCCCEGERGSSWLRDPWSWRQLCSKREVNLYTHLLFTMLSWSRPGWVCGWHCWNGRQQTFILKGILLCVIYDCKKNSYPLLQDILEWITKCQNFRLSHG